MRIQWSSRAAQEMLIHLEKADQGLADCIRQAALAGEALDEANVDGENQALKKAQELFEDDVHELRALAESLGSFINALRKADRMFSETEESIARMAAGMGESESTPVYSEQQVVYHANWEPEAFAVIPNMRLRAAAMPTWLENSTNTSKTIPFMN